MTESLGVGLLLSGSVACFIDVLSSCVCLLVAEPDEQQRRPKSAIYQAVEDKVFLLDQLHAARDKDEREEQDTEQHEVAAGEENDDVKEDEERGEEEEEEKEEDEQEEEEEGEDEDEDEEKEEKPEEDAEEEQRCIAYESTSQC